MANDLANIGGAVPAHIAAAFGGMTNSDLAGGVAPSYPIVSYKGKVWHVVEAGERNLVCRDDGEPAASIDAIIVRANPNLNKVYYPDGYEEGSNEKPTCHSNDSIAPAADAASPQSKKCAVCPHNQWGSKISETGEAKGKACSDSRRLAIIPEGDPERPMLLRVPAASLKTLLAYSQNLDRRGVPYQALVTKIGFDHDVAYPSLTFKATRWLDAEEVEQVKELYESDMVAAITAVNMVSAPQAAAPDEEDDFLPPGGPPAAQTAPAAATKGRPRKGQAQAAEVEAAVSGEPAAEPKKTTGFGAKKTAPAATAPAQAAPAAKAAPVEEPDTVVVEGAMAELDAVLAEFDDG
jgi:hypothetical protein